MGPETEKTETESLENIVKLKTQLLGTELVSRILGENLPPGGKKLTLHLGETLKLNRNSKVLIFKCDTGASALTIKRGFDCEIVGVDTDLKNIETARQVIDKSGLSGNIDFRRSDLQQLAFSDRTFDAIISEGALGSLNDKSSTVSEMYRVLNSGGRIGITDVTIEDILPEELGAILSHVISIPDALSINGYQDLLKQVNFREIVYEDHSYALTKLLEKINRLLPGVQLVKGLFNVDLENILGFSLDDIPHLLALGIEEVEAGNIGYGMFTAEKR